MSNFGHAGRPGQIGGSAPRGLSFGPGKINVRMSLPQSAGEAAYADRVYNAGKADKREHAVVWDSQGHAHEMSGDKSSYLASGDFNGMSMVHNHPTGSSFSGSDIRLAQMKGLASTSVVDDQYVYTLTPGEGRTTFKDVPGDAGSEWDKLFDAIIRALAGPQDTFDEEKSHQLMQALAQKTGMTYTRRSR